MSGTVGLAMWTTSGGNLAVILLILLFLVVPSAVLLVDHARHPKHPIQAAAPGRPLATFARRRPLAPERGVHVVERGSVPTDFWNEAAPPAFGYVPPYTTVRGGFEHRGYLQLAPGAVIQGDLVVHGSLALGAGAEVHGVVDVKGDVYVRTGARIPQGGRASGDLHLDRVAEPVPVLARGVRPTDERHDAPLPADVFGKPAARKEIPVQP